ncbi:MAG: bifunctional 3-deoxy-7-phosphoheptulonate synthase/chorismate mutase type II [Bacteroidales bacterium]|jgi:chorismate mutase|nr:bifunctional 3-deoxy-7-phosphoheptulonate synthase/chorismate mutase type II [Bacteroidales bacterium]
MKKNTIKPIDSLLDKEADQPLKNVQPFSVEPILPRNDGKPILIAGPCGVESKEQLFSTIELLSESAEIDMFRCGIWKPRSSPNSFQGVGKKALPWLIEIQLAYQIPVCIEIATPKHLELALDAGIQNFWIGARTSTNPFMVDEIASVAQGTDISVMIKNPVSPDLQLWYGNFERFVKAGIRKLAGVYRGFSIGSIQPYRNDPMWQLLIDFKRTYRDIPVFCDPSHIAGERNHVFEIAQKALFLDIDGLMIEVHNNPSQALSDKEQQLSAPEFKDLIDCLIFPSKGEKTDHTLEKYRNSLDSLDKELIHLLGKRTEMIKQIASYKKEQNIPILQIERWEKVRERNLAFAKEQRLDISFVESLLDLLHQYSIECQEVIMRKENNNN